MLVQTVRSDSQSGCSTKTVQRLRQHRPKYTAQCAPREHTSSCGATSSAGMAQPHGEAEGCSTPIPPPTRNVRK
jgi:hypothetical protein